jgi:hypothetical protein
MGRHTLATNQDLHSSLLSSHQRGLRRVSVLTACQHRRVLLCSHTVHSAAPPPTLLLRHFCHLIGKDCRNLSSTSWLGGGGSEHYCKTERRSLLCGNYICEESGQSVNITVVDTAYVYEYARTFGRNLLLYVETGVD